MSKPTKPPHAHPKPTPTPSNSEDIDLRLQRQLQLNQQAQLELSQTQTQLSYCANFLRIVREQHGEMRGSYLLARGSQFGGWETRINQLTLAAINQQTQQTDSSTSKTAVNSIKKGSCSQGKHLQQVLERTTIEKQQAQIGQLEQKLSLLYDKISSSLHEQLLSDKILGRIKREARRAAKSKLLPLMDREIARYRDWQAQSSSQMDSDLQAKEVEQQVMRNLEQMKLIMGKKIATNDYIYQQYGEENCQVYALIDRMDRLADSLQQDYLAANALIKQRYLQVQTDAIEPRSVPAPPKPLDLASVSAYFQQTQDIINQLEDSPQQIRLHSQYQRILSQLDSRISTLLGGKR